MSKMCIVPDKIILIKAGPLHEKSGANANAQAINPTLYGENLNEISIRIHAEHELNLSAVCNTFNNFIFTYDTKERPIEKTLEDLARMINLRFRTNAPRRPPRVILLGPPGSGRTTTAEIICSRFGLVNVSPLKLLQAEAKRNPAIKNKLIQSQEMGVEVPDDILLRVVDARLN